MDGSKNADTEIETGLENINSSTNEKDHDEKVDESALKIPTFGFTEKSLRTDFVFIVEGTRLFVNKTILYLASPVFDTMLHSDFKESSCDELELPGKKLRDVVDFLRCIYPSTLSQITPESAFNVLPLVEEYQVNHLKPRCETAILKNVSEDTPVDELFRILHVACLYNLVNLRKRCVQIAGNKSQEDIDEAFENNPPPAEAAKEILEKINTKLRDTVCEQKQLIDDMSRQATKSIDEQKEKVKSLEAKSIEHEKQLTIIKQYLSRDIKGKKEFSLDINCNWKEYITIFDVDMKIKEAIKSAEVVNIWNVYLVVCISIQSESGYEKFLHFEMKNLGEKITFRLKGRAIIVNRQPKGENETVFLDSYLSPGYPSWNCLQKDLINMSRINNIENGYLSDGHVGMIVQMFISEPNRG